MDLLTMSPKEVNRLEVMQRLDKRGMKQRVAAELLGVSERQVKRLLRRYRKEGARGLVSRRRGRPSSNQLAEGIRRKVLDLLKSKYSGFGPTLACEKLVEVEGLKISDESVRQLMMAEGLWKGKKARKLEVHQMRERRACDGELEQMDGTGHDWFEGRSERCTLLVVRGRIVWWSLAEINCSMGRKKTSSERGPVFAG
jgi:transposase